MSVEMSVAQREPDTTHVPSFFGGVLWITETPQNARFFRENESRCPSKTSVIHYFWLLGSQKFWKEIGSLESTFYSRPTIQKLMMKLLTIDDAAVCLSVSKSTVVRLIRDCEIDVTRIGRSVRISEDALNRYIDARTTYRGFEAVPR